MKKVLTQEENKLTGDTSKLRGDVSGLTGNVDNAKITAEERAQGIDIAELIKESK